MHHLIEHVRLAVPGGGHVRVRVVERRRLRQAGQERRFGQRQIFGRLAEIGFGGRFDPIGPIAVQDLVHVHLEDLILGVAAGQLHGQEGLFDLAFGGLLGAEQGVLDELLGDGRGAALGCAAAYPLVRGAHDGAHVEARVVVERGVFGGDRGVAHDFRDVGQVRPGCVGRPRGR